MPKLLTCVPCLKGINGDDGLLTIVSVLEFVRITTPPDATLPEGNAVIDLQWQLVSLWYQEPEDAGKQFVQTVEIFLPDGARFLSGTFPIDLSNRTSRVKIDGRVFPIGIAGEVVISVGYVQVGTTEAREQVRYPVLVEHVAQEPAGSTPDH